MHCALISRAGAAGGAGEPACDKASVLVQAEGGRALGAPGPGARACGSGGEGRAASVQQTTRASLSAGGVSSRTILAFYPRGGSGRSQQPGSGRIPMHD